MTKWREVRLGDVVEAIYSGGTPKTSIKEYWNGSIKWLTSGETESKYIHDTVQKITKLGVRESATKYVPKDNIVIASAGQGKTRGQVSFLLDDMCINQSLIAVVSNDKYLINKFLFYNLSSRYEEIRMLSDASSSRGSITTSFMERLKIKIPDLKTQEKIANVLSTYDKLIENNNRRIELLEQMAEEIYKEWFVRMRFPGHEETKFEKGIPEGWEVKRIGDLAKFKRGKNLRISDAIKGNVPVIAGGIEPSCYHNKSNTIAPVITVSASGANAGYTKLNYTNVWASDCSYIDINDTSLIYYIYLVMKVSSNEIFNLQKGSAQPHVYAKDINNFSFLMPQKHLVYEINSLAKEIFSKISLLHQQNQNLIKQRDMLLPRLMNGTIEVE